MKKLVFAVGLCMLALSGRAYANGSENSDCPAPASASTGVEGQTLRPVSPLENVAAANARARQRPEAGRFVEARQIYVYADGAIYELYANPGFVSVILLEPGERLIDAAAGDTSRWMIQEAPANADGRTIVLVKPQAIALRTNIVLVTDRRFYSVEAVSQGGRAYSAEIAWCYPVNTQTARANAGQALNFSYRVRVMRGARPSWTPVRVYDDGRRTWIDMPETIASDDLPPLFVVSGEGRELVNYRVQGGSYIVDRLFDAAELRLGSRNPIVVRIERAPDRRSRERDARLRSGPS